MCSTIANDMRITSNRSALYTVTVQQVHEMLRSGSSRVCAEMRMAFVLNRINIYMETQYKCRREAGAFRRQATQRVSCFWIAHSATSQIFRLRVPIEIPTDRVAFSCGR